MEEMKESSTTTTTAASTKMNNNKTSSSSELILLPISRYGAISWKVKHRSIVRKGETIALIYPRKVNATTDSFVILGNGGGSFASTTGSSSGKHLRPSSSTSSRAKKSLGTESPTETKKCTAATASSDKESVMDLSDGIQLLATTDGLINIYYDHSRIDTTNNENQRILGFIEPCRHPTIIDGMCAVCGRSLQTEQQGSLLQVTSEGKQPTSSSSSSSLTIPRKKLSKGLKSLISDKLGADPNYVAPTNTSNSSTPNPYHKVPTIVPTTLSSGRNIQPKPIFLDTTTTTTTHNIEPDGGGAYHQSSDKDDDEHNTNNLLLSRVTVSGGITVNISQEEATNITKENRKRLLNNNRLSLVLDLDHTLVHATNDTRAALEFDREDVRLILLPFPTTANNTTVPLPQHHYTTRHYVKMRPFLKEFLLGILDKYEACIYTAGTRAYAMQVVRAICRYVVGAMDEEELIYYKNCLREAQSKIQYLEQQQLQVQQQQQQQRVDDDTTDNVIHESDAAIVEEQNGDVQKRTVVAEAAVATKQLKEIKSNNDDNSNNLKTDDPVENSTTETKRVSFSSETQVFIIPEETDSTTLNEQVADLQKKINDAEALEIKACELELKLFGSRVVSRCDVGDLGRDVKSVRRVFPCGGMMAAIIDDREDVWANASDNITSQGAIPGEPPTNLILIKPYHFEKFRGFAEVNNPAGFDITAVQEKLQSDSDNAETDDGLFWCNSILSRLHQRFYLHVARDKNNPGKKDTDITVPQIVDQMRKEVLRGCSVVISGLIPLADQSRSETKVKVRSPIVRYVEQLGGTITPDVNEKTTHVIAARTGTEKVFKGVRIQGCAIVNVDWLMWCYWSISARDVTPYLLLPIRVKETALENNAGKPLKKEEVAIRGAQQALPNTKDNTVTLTQKNLLLAKNRDAESSDDESFAAELERSILTENSERQTDRAPVLLLTDDDDESDDDISPKCSGSLCLPSVLPNTKIQRNPAKAINVSSMHKRNTVDMQQSDSAEANIEAGKKVTSELQKGNKRLKSL